MPSQDVTVAGIGADGDGIAPMASGAALYLPFTLPGEQVRAAPDTRRGEGWAGSAEILVASPDRATPPCPHFGVCGGCSLQHWVDAPYADWKRDQVASALQRAGASTELPPLARTPPEARRRIELSFRRLSGPQVEIGLHGRRAREIVDMHACPVLHPVLFGLVQALRPALGRLDALRREGGAVINLLESGPDLTLRTDGLMSAPDRSALAAFATAHGLARISWAYGSGPTELVCQLRAPRHVFSGHVVEPPPAAFLQASVEGEAAIVAAVLAGLPSLPARGRIVELFAGCGTLTAALVARGRVEAFEGDAAACGVLRRAALPRATVTQRDLARQPLQIAELKGVDAVVLDPPWAGAAAQMQALAGSGVRAIVYVSCNPAALVRDAKTLLLVGYRITSATAIDQFLWSSRVESVIHFQRDRVRMVRESRG